MATFTSWAAEYTRYKNAVASMTTEQMIQAGYTTVQGQTTTFKKLSDIIEFGEWLKAKADEEANTGGKRASFFCFGNGGLG